MSESQTISEAQQQETQSKNNNIKSINFDDFQTMIFDLGSYNYRIGYSGNDRPNFIFPPIKFLENQENEYEYLTSQKGDGFFVDIKKFEDFFDDFISDKELINEMNQGSLLFSEPVIHDKDQRMKLTQFLFEKYEIGGLFFCNSSVLSSFSYGKTSCLIFDSGNAQSNIVPVHDGMIIKNALNYYSLNGKYINELIVNELIGKQIDNFKSYNILENIQILSDIKDIIFTSESIKNEYLLPDKKSIIINENYISEIKKNIEFKIFNDELNLKNLILKTISSVLLDIKKDLISNIFVCGGNSLILNNYFDNIKEALAKELVSSAIVRLITHPSKIERSLASFLGASIVSSLNIYKETIVKKEEYEEHGAIIIEKKCA
jgi:actin-like protein 6A